MKKLIVIAIALSTAFTMYGQYKGGIWNYTWDVSIPLGETSDFTGVTSGRGVTISGKGFVSENIALGGQFSWHTFYEKEFTTSSFDITNSDDERIVGDINGTQLRYINSFPILFTAHYFTKNPVFSEFSLFAGLGAGTSIIKRRLEIGIVAFEETKWHFTMAPEVGIVYGFNTNLKLFLSAQYFYSVKTSTTPSQSHMTFHIGFASTF